MPGLSWEPAFLRLPVMVAVMGRRGGYGEVAVNDIDLLKACPLFSDCENRLARATVAGNMSWFLRQ